MGSQEDEQVPPGVSAGLPPPNWYQDPQDPWRSRYWDGTRWTEHTHPHPLAAPTVAPVYRSLVTPARTLFVLFAVTLVLTVVALLSDWAELSLLGRMVEDPASVSPAEADASDLLQGLIGLLQLLLYLGTGVTFLVWFWRAYRNLPVLGAKSLRFSSGWAVGAWFVPFLNLVRPKQMTDDIWRASDPALPARPGTAWKQQRVPALLHWWWALFILSGVLGWATFRSEWGATSPQELQTASAVTLAGDFLDLPLTILAFQVVAQVTRRQEARAGQLAVSRTAWTDWA
jgi:Domain of unknown function (DUF4328)/Protein of unknown function (DUF2510)